MKRQIKIFIYIVNKWHKTTPDEAIEFKLLSNKKQTFHVNLWMRNELQLRLSIRLEWLSNDSITKLLGDDVIVSIKCLPCLTKHQAKCVSIGYFKAFSKIIFNFISILSNFPFSNSYPNSVSQKNQFYDVKENIFFDI